MLAGFQRLAGQHGVAGGGGRDDERVTGLGDGFERGEHLALADLSDLFTGCFDVEVEHADELGVVAGGEFLGVIAAEDSCADDTDPDLALVGAGGSSRSGRGFDTLH